MKEFVQHAKESPSSCMWILYKHTFVGNYLIFFLNTAILSIILYLIFPLISDISLTEIESRINSIQGGETDAIIRSMTQILDLINLPILAFMGLIGIFWNQIIQTYLLNRNDRFIRHNDFERDAILSAPILSQSLRIFMGQILFMVLFIIASGIIVLLLAEVAKIQRALAVVLALALFFFLAVSAVRMILFIPAVIHGNKGLVEAASFSWKKIHFGRALKITLMGFAVLIIVSIFMAIFQKTIELISKDYILNQTLNSVINSLFSIAILAFFSTLYFRYTDEAIEDLDGESHLVADDELI